MWAGMPGLSARRGHFLRRCIDRDVIFL